MRADMHKVVVERERGGMRGNRKWSKRLPFVPDDDYDDQLKFASSGRRRQYGHRSKWFTDVLGRWKDSCAVISDVRGTRCTVSCGKVWTSARSLGDTSSIIWR